MPSSGPLSNALDNSAIINPMMRSNASSCTGPAGLAKHHASGTRSIPPITSARSMAPAIGTEVPFTAANSGAPTVSFGNPPGWTKST